MKIYQLSSPSCLLDVIDKIIHIEICEDASSEFSYLTQMPESLAASTDITADTNYYDQQEEDAYYLGVSDEALLALDPSVIHKFRNLDLIIRVGKLDGSLLSHKQSEYMHSVLEQKSYGHNYLMDKDIEDLLDMIKKCNSVSYDFRHEKTNRFALNKNGELRTKMVLRILRSLTLEDWRYKTRSVNWKHLGNTLFVFKPHVDYVDSDGNHHSNVEVYVKLDVDESTKSAVALVSMHD